ncbi:uncharacterized protein LOC116957433 isoform X2 [Petromyzon marinus]
MVKITGAAVTIAVLMITAGTPRAAQFFLSARALPWSVAARYCHAHGGHLATVGDARLNARLAHAATHHQAPPPLHHHHAPSHAPPPHHHHHQAPPPHHHHAPSHAPPPHHHHHASFWLGLRRDAAGVWRWLESGSPAPFLPWAPGEPNGRKRDEECVELYVGAGGGGGGGGGGDERHGRWNDDGCRRKKRALCYRDQALASRGSAAPGQESPIQVLIDDAPGLPRSGGRSTATPLRALPTAAPEVWSTAAPPRLTTKPVALSTVAPVQSTADPVQFEQSPAQSTADPVRSTVAPVQFEQSPAQSTADPVRSTVAPIRSTIAPVQSTVDPAHFEQSPAQSTADPVRSTAAPIRSTIPPVQSTIAPAQSTSDAPLQFEQSPVPSQRDPFLSTAAPVHWKPTPVRPAPTEASAPRGRPGARRKTRVEVQEPEFPVPGSRGGGGEDGDEVAGGGRVAAVVALGGVSLTSGAWLITFALKRRKSGSFFLQHNQTR